MNKTAVLTGIATVAVALSAAAQGTINFSSASVTGRPRITKDGVNTGANITVELLVANPGNGGAFESVKTTAGLTGAAALEGLFSGGTVTVPFVAPGAAASVVVRAWDTTTGATFAAATVNGSTSFDIAALGGAGTPPSTPAIMSNYAGIALVPEPSTYALAALGLGGLLFLRRK